MNSIGSSRLGMKGYARIYAAMPGTAQEIAERADVTLLSAQQVCREMLTLGLAHRSGIRQVGPNKSQAAIYTAGPGESVPFRGPGYAPSRPRSKLIAFASLMRALAEPLTEGELREETGLAQTSMKPLLKYMHQLQIARIGGWVCEKGKVRMAMWVLGSGRNVSRPPPVTRKEINAAYVTKRREMARARRLMAALCGNAEQFREAA